MGYRFCPKCDNKYQSYADCPECGIPLHTPNASNNQQVDGNNNQNIQISGDHTGDIVFTQEASNNKNQFSIYRESIEPLTIKGKHLQNSPVSKITLITTVLSFLLILLKLFNSLISSIKNFDNSPDYSFLLLLILLMIGAIGLSIFLASLILKSDHHIAINIPLLGLNKTIEHSKKNDDLFITTIKGTCGECQHPVTIKATGDKGNRQTSVVCTNNRKHRTEFDWAKLPDVGDAYKQQESSS